MDEFLDSIPEKEVPPSEEHWPDPWDLSKTVTYKHKRWCLDFVPFKWRGHVVAAAFTAHGDGVYPATVTVKRLGCAELTPE